VPDVSVIRGTVTLDGLPTRTAKVGLGPLAGTPDHFRPLIFDVSQGTFSGRVPPGAYHVHVRIPGKRFELEEPLVVASAPLKTIDLNLRSEMAVRSR